MFKLGNQKLQISTVNFQHSIDFGANFPGAGRWLEIAVRTNGAGAFSTLSPRQPLTLTPYTVFAHTASNLSGLLPASQLSGTPTAAVNFTGSLAGEVTGTQNAAVVARVGGQTAANIANGAAAANAWRIGGNAGTTPGTCFLGTTDHQPLELKVKNQRGLRLEPTASTDTVNVIGGSTRNSVGAGVVGATISGGGTGDYSGDAYVNRVEAHFGTVTATAFNPPSDRNLKENFAPVSPREVLEKVAALPISRWNFKGDSATPHVGPMAQDFHAAFRVGPDERHIATVDADGVALAAIQGLNEKLEDRSQKSEDRSRKLEEKVQLKETEIAQLKARREALEQIIRNQKAN